MISFPFIYNGTEYRSLLAFCKGEGLPYTSTAARVRAGRPLRDLFYEGHLGKAAKFGGIDLAGHPSVRAMAKASGLSYGKVYNRLAAGRSVEEAMTRRLPRRPRTGEVKGNAVEYGGVLYPTLSHAARAAGLPPVAVYQRWHRGKRGPDLFAPLGPPRFLPRVKLTPRQPLQGDATHVST